MSHRAWVFNAEQTEITLVDVGDKPLYFGHPLPDGCMVARQAWAYEYKGVYTLGRVEQVALTHYKPLPNRKPAEASPAPVQRPKKATKTRSVAGVSPVGVILDEVSTWRSDRLAATIANPY